MGRHGEITGAPQSMSSRSSNSAPPAPAARSAGIKPSEIAQPAHICDGQLLAPQGHKPLIENCLQDPIGMLV